MDTPEEEGGWCDECQTFDTPEHPCECVEEIDLDASVGWLKRLNPGLDLSMLEDN